MFGWCGHRVVEAKPTKFWVPACVKALSVATEPMSHAVCGTTSMHRANFGLHRIARLMRPRARVPGPGEEVCLRTKACAVPRPSTSSIANSRSCTEPEMGGRLHLNLDSQGLAVSGRGA